MSPLSSLTPTDGTQGSWATVSDDGLYRYDLGRFWGDADRLALWVMLNPSTADASEDDPTIRRVRGFSRIWGFGGCVVVNLFALRTTKPEHLLDHPDPSGSMNVEKIRLWMEDRRVGAVVCAWGAGWRKLDLPRPNVEGKARFLGKSTVCLGRTKAGDPRHPLYVPKNTPPEPFGPEGD